MKSVQSVVHLFNYEWLLVLLLAPFLMFPTVRPRVTAVALCVLVLWWGARLFLRGEAWPVTPLNGALLLFVFSVLVSTWVTRVPFLTIPKVTNLILDLAVFRATVFAFRSRRSLQWGVVAFVLLSMGLMLGGALGTPWSGKIPGLPSLSSTPPVLKLPEAPSWGVHPNQLAVLPVLYLPIAFSLLMYSVGVRPRRYVVAFLLAGSLLISGSVLFFTQSRSGWMGGLAAFVVLLGGWILKARRKWWGVLYSTVMVLGGVGAWAYFKGYDGFSQLVDIKYAGVINLVPRMNIWAHAMYALRDFPLTGVGLGTFREVAPAVYPVISMGTGPMVPDAHNILLQMGIDLGFPGLVAYLAMLFVLGAVCFRILRHAGASFESAMALGGGSALVGLHVYGLSNSLNPGSKPAVAFWMLIAFLVGLEQSLNSRIRPKKEKIHLLSTSVSPESAGHGS